jgi:hypothetical protein
MAEDVVALLDYIGWTADRDIHVVGISLGGMIAQGFFRLVLSRVKEMFTPLVARVSGSNSQTHHFPHPCSDTSRRHIVDKSFNGVCVCMSCRSIIASQACGGLSVVESCYDFPVSRQ